MATDTQIYRLCVTIYVMMQLQKKLACALGGLKHCICHRVVALMLSSTAHPMGSGRKDKLLASLQLGLAPGTCMYHVLGYRMAPQVAAVRGEPFFKIFGFSFYPTWLPFSRMSAVHLVNATFHVKNLASQHI